MPNVVETKWYLLNKKQGWKKLRFFTPTFHWNHELNFGIVKMLKFTNNCKVDMISINILFILSFCWSSCFWDWSCENKTTKIRFRCAGGWACKIAIISLTFKHRIFTLKTGALPKLWVKCVIANQTKRFFSYTHIMATNCIIFCARASLNFRANFLFFQNNNLQRKHVVPICNDKNLVGSFVINS